MPAVPCRGMRYKNSPLSTLSYRVLPAETSDYCILTSHFRTVVDYFFCLLYHGDQSDAEKKEMESLHEKLQNKAWLDTFEENVRSGNIMDANDAMVMKALVEEIIVNDTGIEIHCKCGVTIEQEYIK